MDKLENIIELDDKLLEIGDSNEYDVNHEEALSILKEGLLNETYFSGLCNKCDSDGNLYIDINGITCIMERNEVSIPIGEENVHKGLCQKKVGAKVQGKVIKIDDTDNSDIKIYLSRKDFVKKIRSLYNTSLQIGTVVKGVITNIDETKGVFVDIGGDYVGIIPRGNLENLYVTNLTDHVSIGEVVKVVVIELKRNKAGDIVHLALDRKSLLPKFRTLAKNYKKGDILLAKIKSIQANGIYCSLDKHLDVICDFNYNKYRIDQNVRVKINSVKYDKHRITGSIIS